MGSKQRTGLFTGSFDPVTFGHLDLIKRSFSCVDHLIVALGIHPTKQGFLKADIRKALLEEACNVFLPEYSERITVITFSSLAVDVAYEHNADVIIRGLRDSTDLDYEMQMAGMNSHLNPEIQTVFLPASAEVRCVSSTHVRQIAAMGGNIRAFVPENVAAYIERTQR